MLKQRAVGAYVYGVLDNVYERIRCCLVTVQTLGPYISSLDSGRAAVRFVILARIPCLE